MMMELEAGSKTQDEAYPESETILCVNIIPSQ